MMILMMLMMLMMLMILMMLVMMMMMMMMKHLFVHISISTTFMFFSKSASAMWVYYIIRLSSK